METADKRSQVKVYLDSFYSLFMYKKKIAVNFGQVLKFYRERAELSQLDLAILSKVAASTIQKAEVNLITPSDKNKHRLADALKLNPKEHALLCGVNLYIDGLDLNSSTLKEKDER